MPQSSATIFAKTMPRTDALFERSPLTEKQHLNTELGQLFAKLYLKQLGNDGLGEAGAKLHTKLTSDKLTINEEERRTYTISWKTEWETLADAKAFEQFASELSSIPARKPAVTISENQVIIQFIDIHTGH